MFYAIKTITDLVFGYTLWKQLIIKDSKNYCRKISLNIKWWRKKKKEGRKQKKMEKLKIENEPKIMGGHKARLYNEKLDNMPVGATSSRPLLRRHCQKQKRYHINSARNHYNCIINSSRSSAKPNIGRTWHTKPSRTSRRAV